jgi:hypothetical protein
MRKKGNYFVNFNMPRKLLAICFVSSFVCSCAGRQAVLAVSGTVIGVEISQNPANQSPQAKLGYNRGEIAIVPTNRSALEDAGASLGGARDIADVIMEIRYGGIFDTGPSSGIYQRLAVGSTAVTQPGASFMFAKDADGKITNEATEALKSLEMIKSSDQRTIVAIANLGDRRRKDPALREKIDAEVKKLGYESWDNFVDGKPREPTLEQVESILKAVGN